ncbi:MAG: glucose-1-phosphate adenylyltransferase [Ruminococcaceae bacterium]|nr:glucose-1-phosphate adenylyltransferase [Oscillospiraceae bacterium]
MRKQKECVAMLLAGGEGSRLQPLTQYLAKPAVPFGGKYRIVDFTLSNCANSGIDTVGVLTQYQPLLLNEYIGNGQPWDLDRNFGGVQILPPYKAKRGGDWYHGTANAVWQNRQFLERYAPKYVLVLSGDHIYRMNYRALIEQHKEKRADCTIAVIDVPIDEANRFGILSADENDFITDFEEKPKEPKSTLASMGIYVFNTEYLFRYLEADEADRSSKNDFGKNVIPAMLREGGRLAVHRFAGYWRDVGTLESLWQANMDLIGEHPAFDLFRGNGRIFSRSDGSTPQYVGAHGSVQESILSQGCRIDGRVERSVLSPDVVVEEGACVIDSVLMNGAHVEKGATVVHSILDEMVTVAKGAVIGEKEKLTVIGRGTEA